MCNTPESNEPGMSETACSGVCLSSRYISGEGTTQQKTHLVLIRDFICLSLGWMGLLSSLCIALPHCDSRKAASMACKQQLMDKCMLYSGCMSLVYSVCYVYIMVIACVSLLYKFIYEFMSLAVNPLCQPTA